jgi:hypothetical protein
MTMLLDNMYDLIRDNMLKFRQRFNEFSKLPFILIPETNARFIGEALDMYFTREKIFHGEKNVPQYSFITDKTSDKFGVTKTYLLTLRYLDRFDNFLIDNSVRFHDKITTANKDRSIDSILLEVFDQLDRFEWPDKDPKNPRYKSGKKNNGKQNGNNDDLAITFLMGAYFGYERRELFELKNEFFLSLE